MVTRSNLNYGQHKIDVYNFLKKINEKKARDFIRFYGDRYDKFGRSLLYYKVAWLLYQDYHRVKKSGVSWYAFCGTGGTGKTTTAKNLLYFLDSTFNASRIVNNSDDLIKVLDTFPKTNAMKAILLDEPDQTLHPQSTEGKNLRSILGKARQQKLFIGLCATDLRDIPSYLYKKISTLVFTEYLGSAMFIRDRPKKFYYPVPDLKHQYSKIGYKAFQKFRGTNMYLRFKTNKLTPLSQEDTDAYLSEKEKDYAKDIKVYLTSKQQKETKIKPVEDKKINMIKEMSKAGLTNEKMAKVLNLGVRRIQQIIKNNGIFIPKYPENRDIPKENPKKRMDSGTILYTPPLRKVGAAPKIGETT